MTTFTAWKFDTPGGAQAAREQLDLARAEGLVKVIDRAVLEWPEGAEKPSLRHSRDDEWRGTGWGAFWGLLVGTLFFVPMLGAVAIGAGAGALHKHLQGVGITKEQLESIRDQTVPGTSVLFAVTDEGNLDRLGERFRGFQGHLVSTNLTGAERALLLETFD
ncbi:MAG TPA: DUF1269 domain-containing protein [Marmoricola sp.]